MRFLQLVRVMRRIHLSGSLLVALSLVMVLQASGATAAPLKANTSAGVARSNVIPFNANAEHLREIVRNGQLA